MKLDNELSSEQFREEMQHRVVKYPLNSRPVKEALRFAKKHEDPAFYRIASDKIHAQRQFQRELYGPGRLERLIDFVSLGSLREVVVTLVLVAAGVLGLDVTRRAMYSSRETDLYSHLDVEELATRLGIVLDATKSRAKQPPSTAEQPDSGAADKREPRPSHPAAGSLSDADIARIADAVSARLAARKTTDAVGTTRDTRPVDSATKEPAKAITTTESPADLATLTNDDPSH